LGRPSEAMRQLNSALKDAQLADFKLATLHALRIAHASEKNIGEWVNLLGICERDSEQGCCSSRSRLVSSRNSRDFGPSRSRGLVVSFSFFDPRNENLDEN
jgi:hypothetical protein